jgi:4-amino-4-deoxy-L-arabinose transferase-like glycosyltransferase
MRQQSSPRWATPARASETLWVLGGIVILGAIIRFQGLGSQSFWPDEAVTHGIVMHSLGHVLSTVPRTESTPPLYYVLLWLWSQVFGTDEAGLRSFSALCGTLTIPVVWAIGRELFSARIGLLAALLVAINPLLFWLSQETRTYSLLGLLSALSLLTLVRALDHPSRGRIAGWGVVSAVALCAHYFAAIAVVPEAVWLLVALRRAGLLTRDRVALGLGPIVVATAALTPLAIHQNDGRASYIANSGSLPYRLGELVKQDVGGYAIPNNYLFAAGCALAAAAALALLVRTGRRERSRVAVAVAVGAGGVALAAISAMAATDYIDTRNLVPTLPALLIVVAAAVGSARAGRAGALALAGVVAVNVFGVAAVLGDVHFRRADWRAAARALGPTTEVRAIVSAGPAERGLPPYLSVRLFPLFGARVREVDVLALDGGMLALTPPPVTATAPPGFTLVQRVRTETYTLLRYRSPVPRPVTETELLSLYPPGRESITLAQNPGLPSL